MDLSALRFVERLSLLLGGLVCLGSVFFWQRSIVLGAAVGAGLAVLNLVVLRRLALAAIRSRSSRKRLLLLSLLGAKMALLIALVYVVVRYLPVSVAAFAVGLSTMVVSVIIGGLRVSADTVRT